VDTNKGISLADPLAVDIIKRQDVLEKSRAVWETTWREIAIRIAPQEQVFFHGSPGNMGAGMTIDQARMTGGIRQDLFQYDAAPTQYWEKYGAVLSSITIPKGSRWHNLRAVAPELARDINVKRYCEDFTDLLFSIRYSGKAGFDSAAFTAYLSNGLYGHGWIFIEDRLAEGIAYCPIHMSQIYPIENHLGVIDRIHRKYTLTAEQAFEKWHHTNKLPEQILKSMENATTKDKIYTFIHAVYPNNTRDKTRRDYRGMPYVAHDICVETKTILSTGGFRAFPYAVARSTTLPQQTYSLSPAFLCLADIKTLNEMMKTSVRYAQLTLDPPLMLRDVDSLAPWQTRPGFLNKGYLDEDGKPSVVGMKIEGDPRFAAEIVKEKRDIISANFYNTLFDILVQSPEMTATQALIRNQEKGALLAPIGTRLEKEFLNVIISREVQICKDAGAAPKPPDALLAYGAGLKIEYDSPLTQAQKSQEGAGILQTMQAAAQMAEFDPNVRFRLNWDQALQTLATIYSCPASVVRSDDEYQAAVQAQQQAEQAAQAAQQMLPASQAVKNIGQAQAGMSRNQPNAGQQL
jgi:hypothetical protein